MPACSRQASGHLWLNHTRGILEQPMMPTQRRGLRRIHSTSRHGEADDKADCALHCLQVVSDLGLLTLSNSVAWQQNAQPSDPAAVLLDTAVVSLKGLGAVVDADGHRGGNIVREYEEGLKVGIVCSCHQLPVVPSVARLCTWSSREPQLGGFI